MQDTENKIVGAQIYAPLFCGFTDTYFESAERFLDGEVNNLRDEFPELRALSEFKLERIIKRHSSHSPAWKAARMEIGDALLRIYDPLVPGLLTRCRFLASVGESDVYDGIVIVEIDVDLKALWKYLNTHRSAWQDYASESYSHSLRGNSLVVNVNSHSGSAEDWFKAFRSCVDQDGDDILRAVLNFIALQSGITHKDLYLELGDIYDENIAFDRDGAVAEALEALTLKSQPQKHE